MTANVWINEIDYDQGGFDGSEFVELAGVAGTSLVGWQLLLYDGSTGSAYKTFSLDGAGKLFDDENGYGVISLVMKNADTIEDGGTTGSPSPDGVALVDDQGAVVQFLSYEGSFMATDGAAIGMTSTDIGISDSETQKGSVHLAGTGKNYGDFHWEFGKKTDGFINAGEHFPSDFAGDVTGKVEEYVTPMAKGKITFADPMSTDKFVAQSHEQSDKGFGTFSINAAGKWTYTVTPDKAAVHALDTGDVLKDSLTIETADHKTTKIAISIQGITDLIGTQHSDTHPPVVGTRLRELIDARKGNDEVFGAGGDDIIKGSAGADKLNGGTGADHFVYGGKDSGITGKTMDLIADFSRKQNDQIDLHLIDANPSTARDDALHLVATQKAASKLGSVWIEHLKEHDVVHINDDAGHKGFDMAVDVHTGTHLSATDFIL